MSLATEFVTTVKQMTETADPYVRGCITALLDSMAMIPAGALTITPVEGVKDQQSGHTHIGYVFTVLADVKDIQLPFEEQCKIALLQRFVGLDENGRAMLYLRYGEVSTPISSFLN